MSNVYILPVLLQCVAVCCSVLQCVAVCCSVLQYVAVCCSVLQCVAVCCSVLKYQTDRQVKRACRSFVASYELHCVADYLVCCSALQHAAVHGKCYAA